MRTREALAFSLVGAAFLLAGGALVKKAVGYVNGRQVDLVLKQIANGFWLRTDAADAWARMVATAAQDGVQLVINSAFRTFEEQTVLYDKYRAGTGNKAAEPGHSNHQAGLAVDVETDGGMNAAFAWLNANAARFGFRRTVAGEPWHWEFFV